MMVCLVKTAFCKRGTERETGDAVGNFEMIANCSVNRALKLLTSFSVYLAER